MKFFDQVCRALLACICSAGFHPAYAQATIDLATLAQKNADFAQMVLSLQPAYTLAFDRQRNRSFAGLYLLSAAPAVPTDKQIDINASDYFVMERPTTGVVWSFNHRHSPQPTPMETVLVSAKLLQPDVLLFRCDRYAMGSKHAYACDGKFDIRDGTFDVGYIDLVFDKLENNLLGKPKEACVRELLQVERQQQECGTGSVIHNFSCSFGALLYARHKCRQASGR